MLRRRLYSVLGSNPWLRSNWRIRFSTLRKFLAVDRAFIGLLVLSTGPIGVSIATRSRLDTELLEKSVDVSIVGTLGSKG